MKVKELIAALQEYDEDLEIAFQKDVEGNGYEYVSGIVKASLNIHDDECIDEEEANNDGYLPDEIEYNVVLFYP